MAERRVIALSDFPHILEAHKKWLESDGKEGDRADLFRAAMSNVSLENVDLRGANLKGAILSDNNLADSRFDGADFTEANLTRANLTNTNLSHALFKAANLESANLQQTQLRDVDLQEATLANAKNLLAEQLGGTNVSGATLPADIAKFELLPRIDELSKSAKRVFLAMLLACAYAALTVFSVTDARLLTDSASSPLPIIQTAIPIVGFFGVAPTILFAIYLYFHLYLQRLWNYLATMPAVFPDGISLDEKIYPWLLNGLVRPHFVLLRENWLPYRSERDKTWRNTVSGIVKGQPSAM